METILASVITGCFSLAGMYLQYKLLSASKQQSAESDSPVSQLNPPASEPSVSKPLASAQPNRPAAARSFKPFDYASRRYFYIFTFFAALLGLSMGVFDLDYTLFGNDFVEDSVADQIGFIALAICLFGSFDTLLSLGLFDRDARPKRKYLYLFAFPVALLGFGMGVFDLDYTILDIDFVEDSVATGIGFFALTVYLFGFVDLLRYLLKRNRRSVS